MAFLYIVERKRFVGRRRLDSLSLFCFMNQRMKTKETEKNSLCLNAWQPGKVLNELNARQSEIFTDFPLKDSVKFLDGS